MPIFFFNTSIFLFLQELLFLVIQASERKNDGKRKKRKIKKKVEAEYSV